jgi:hypothetical protein
MSVNLRGGRQDFYHAMKSAAPVRDGRVMDRIRVDNLVTIALIQTPGRVIEGNEQRAFRQPVRTRQGIRAA